MEDETSDPLHELQVGTSATRNMTDPGSVTRLQADRRQHPHAAQQQARGTPDPHGGQLTRADPLAYPGVPQGRAAIECWSRHLLGTAEAKFALQSRIATVGPDDVPHRGRTESL